MSHRVTIPEFRERKAKEPLVCLTAYTTPVARLMDPHVDLILVGDTLGMVVYGMESTLAVTLDMMIVHGQAVMRGSQHALVVVDLPFGSYQASPADAFRAASRVMKETGCSAVKLEGGEEMAETVAFMVQRGVPVVGHVGLKPQHQHMLGGFRTQTEEARILADGHALAEAGAFSVVVEGTRTPIATRLTQELSVPTIGIGAGPACDGQILVIDDLLGLFDGHQPRFVKRYAEVGSTIAQAVQDYSAEVKARRFPAPEHSYS